MSSKFRFAIIGLIIGALGVWTLNQVVFNAATINVNKMSKSNNSDTVDSHFIEQMIPHHEDAISMAKLAQEKAKRPEVKQLAANIITSQSKEINEMKTWYKTWFGKELPTGDTVMNQHGMMEKSDTHMGLMADGSDMTRLAGAKDFDTAFTEEMIPHHQMAVMMASMLKNGTQRPEMEKLAEDIITSQTGEIEQMRKWLKEWEK